MNRRAFVTGLGAVLAGPLAAGAQQPGKVARVAIVVTTTPVPEITGPHPAHPPIRSLLEALRAIGWIEGQNLILERRSAEGRSERFGDILRELVALPCDVILTTGAQMTEEALRITSTIPIVFTSLDPIAYGFVTSLARPGRNITGVMLTGPEIEGKKLELFRDAVPKARRVAVLDASTSWNGPYGDALRAAASRLAMTLLYAESGPGDYARAFAAITEQRAEAIYVGGGTYLFADRYRIIEFAIKKRLPLMGRTTPFTEAGALLSYNANSTEYWARTAYYVDRLLRGVKPADLPIEQVTKFELVINLKTAKAIGLTIPPSLLLRADQVIE
jgi:putative ABC transport system substrate-binding protein